MFTNGQLTFALLFFIAFVGAMIWSYRKDLKLHKKHYKGSYLVFVGIIIFFMVLFAIKSFLYK